jgi:predicted signal transduction protein with EAL and GGDEF domain
LFEPWSWESSPFQKGRAPLLFTSPKSVAGRPKADLRREDTAAQLSRDDFTILAEDVTSVGDVVRMAERIAEILQPPLALEGLEVFATVSTGIALSSPLQEQPADLLRHVNMAMHQAKDRGKARYEVFESSMGTDALERSWFENEFCSALSWSRRSWPRPG